MGGYLVLSFHEVLSEPGVYQSLKRTLKSGKVDIQGYDPALLFTSSALKPEPIDVEVKVVLIGDAQSYQIFYQHDPDFRKTFKVKADFDTVMERTPESIERYARFIARAARVEKLRPFDRSATAAVVEAGLRLSGSQNKLSTRFSDIADLLREANYWAQQENADIIQSSHIDSHDRGACRTPESDRGPHLGNDPRGGHHDRTRRRSGGSGERPFSL